MQPVSLCLPLLRSLFERHLPLPNGPFGGFPGVPFGSVSALQNALASKCSELAGAESLRRSGVSSALSSCPAGSLSRLHAARSSQQSGAATGVCIERTTAGADSVVLAEGHSFALPHRAWIYGHPCSSGAACMVYGAPDSHATSGSMTRGWAASLTAACPQHALPPQPPGRAAPPGAAYMPLWLRWPGAARSAGQPRAGSP